MSGKLRTPLLWGVCLGLGFGMVSHSGNSRPSIHPELYQCYLEPSSASTPDAATARVSDDATGTAALRSAREAAQQCRSGWCDRETRIRLKDSLSTYLAHRRNVTSALFQERGADGLAEAAQRFSSDDDLKLSKDLAVLYAKGWPGFEDLKQERAALALVLTKPASAFRPCVIQSKSTRARSTVAPYVY